MTTLGLSMIAVFFAALLAWTLYSMAREVGWPKTLLIFIPLVWLAAAIVLAVWGAK